MSNSGLAVGSTSSDCPLSFIPLFLPLDEGPMSKKEILSYLRKNKKLFEREYHIEKIGLIGSFSRGEQHAKSDIDVIAEFKPGTQDLTSLKEELKKMIAQEFRRGVEICREKYLKPYFRKRFLKDVIYI
jgi:predicted nucleotidyltransferase